MAGGPSIYVANLLLNKSLLDTAFTAPSTFYLALFVTAVETNLRGNVVASASEVPNAGAYARQAVARASLTTSTSGLTTISVDVVFPTATATWGDVAQAALMDSSTYGSGNVWYFGPATSVLNIQTGDVYKIPANTFNIRL